MMNRYRWARRFLRSIIAAAILAGGGALLAQQPQQAPADASGQNAPQSTSGAPPAQRVQTPQQAQSAQQAQAARPSTTGEGPNKQGQQSGTSNDRLFWALPNFLTVENSERVPPLTSGQKFTTVARGTFDPVEFAYVGAIAGIGQAQNSEAGYGQGFQGYAKRYGSTFADSGIENFMVGAVFPSLLHQDPRYYHLGKGSFWHRTYHALSRVFIIRSDSGQKQFNYSEILGSGVAAGISNFYHPAGDRTLGDTASTWGTQVGLAAMPFVVKEFWPDIRHAIHKEKPAPGSAMPALPNTASQQ
jgi:hypothetical protein